MDKLTRGRSDNKGTKSDLHERVQLKLGPDLSAYKFGNLPPTSYSRPQRSRKNSNQSVQKVELRSDNRSEHDEHPLETYGVVGTRRAGVEPGAGAERTKGTGREQTKVRSDLSGTNGNDTTSAASLPLPLASSKPDRPDATKAGMSAFTYPSSASLIKVVIYAPRWCRFAKAGSISTDVVTEIVQDIREISIQGMSDLIVKTIRDMGQDFMTG